MKKNKNNEIDWIIHAVEELGGKVCLHTHGLKEHGLTELSVCAVPDVYSVEEMSSMINTVGRMMVEGEEFAVNPTIRHCIDAPDGKTKFKFIMFRKKCYGEDTIRLDFKCLGE